MPLLLRKTNVQALKERRVQRSIDDNYGVLENEHVSCDYKKQARCIEQRAREAVEA